MAVAGICKAMVNAWAWVRKSLEDDVLAGGVLSGAQHPAAIMGALGSHTVVAKLSHL